MVWIKTEYRSFWWCVEAAVEVDEVGQRWMGAGEGCWRLRRGEMPGRLRQERGGGAGDR